MVDCNVVVDRSSDVEPATGAMSVEPDDPTVGIGDGATGRATYQRSGVLDSAVHLTATRTVEGKIDRRHHPVRDARAVTTAAEGEDDVAGVGRRLLGPGRRRDRTGVDVEHDQVAVFVGADDSALLGAAVGEGDQRRAIAQVVGIGQHLAGGDHDAAAATVLTDGDERRPELGEH